MGVYTVNSGLDCGGVKCNGRTVHLHQVSFNIPYVLTYIFGHFDFRHCLPMGTLLLMGGYVFGHVFHLDFILV